MVASAASYRARPIQAAAAAASLLGRGEEETETAGLLLWWIHGFSGAGILERQRLPGGDKEGEVLGSGVYYHSMSGRYKGQFKMGLRHGFGVYRFYTGDVYAGEWLAVEFILVMMGASMLGSSSGGLSMVLDTTISENFLKELKMTLT
ncbi:hypothetical protein AHAS_Ahas13G0245700 [Arachis hypogaea]